MRSVGPALSKAAKSTCRRYSMGVHHRRLPRAAIVRRVLMPKAVQMPKDPVYLTAAGKAELEVELDELLTVKRPEIAAKILSAREDGDLKENGAYHDAKDRQGLMEARIRELKSKLDRAAIIETPSDVASVVLGSTVT